ncbi:MAG: hypothetical protein ACRCW2_03965, partial [Cellulosilyticaceae bacterium]
ENEAVLAEFVQEVNQNRLVGLSDEIVKRVDLQLMSYQHILAYYAQNRSAYGKIGKRLMPYIEQLSGKALDEGEQILREKNQEFQQVLKDYDYVIEHYMVNLLFDSKLYLGKHMKLFYELLIRYAYLRIFLVGYDTEEINLEILSELIVDIERNMGHSDLFRKSVEQIIASHTLTLENSLCMIIN